MSTSESESAGSGNPSGKSKDVLLEHEYDGIREYDNPLPGWWLATFWLTIAFCPVYFFVYHLSPGGLVSDEFTKDSSELAAVQQAAALAEEATEANLAPLVKDERVLALGKEIWNKPAKCASCHGKEGEGGIGPNVCDKFSLHGNTLMQLYTVIRDGVPAKGMIAWGKSLKPEELRAITAYVKSLEGTSPKNPKKPQGKPF